MRLCKKNDHYEKTVLIKLMKLVEGKAAANYFTSIPRLVIYVDLIGIESDLQNTVNNYTLFDVYLIYLPSSV